MIYTADELTKEWPQTETGDGRWVLARPLTLGVWRRIKAAFLVLVGRCDAVRWVDQ